MHIYTLCMYMHSCVYFDIYICIYMYVYVNTLLPLYISHIQICIFTHSCEFKHSCSSTCIHIHNRKYTLFKAYIHN